MEQTPEILQFFEYDHLPDYLADVSRQFYELACLTITLLPDSVERAVALRKLLEAKDAAVRAQLLLFAERRNAAIKATVQS